MFVVIRMEERDKVGVDPQVVTSGFETEAEACDAAKLLSETFKHNAYKGEHKYYWGRHDTGPVFMFFTQGI